MGEASRGQRGSVLTPLAELLAGESAPTPGEQVREKLSAATGCVAQVQAEAILR